MGAGAKWEVYFTDPTNQANTKEMHYTYLYLNLINTTLTFSGPEATGVRSVGIFSFFCN